MHKIIFLLVGIILILAICGSTQSVRESIAISVADSTLPDKYICGFTGSFAYADNFPLAQVPSSADDSAIERTFAAIWRNVIGSIDSTAIKIEKDADQNNTEYKYAAAKGSYNDFGNIVRHIFYKSNDLSPLLHRDNGWCFIAIALHEFGHHINCDPFTGKLRDEAELGADDYAGLMMGRVLKISLDTALLAFSTLTEEHPTNGYPNREKRIAAVKAGWERGQKPARYSLVSAFVKVKGTTRGFYFDDKYFDFEDIQNAINNNGVLKTLKDKSTIKKAEVKTEASNSPGEFFLDSNYLYFKKTNSAYISIVGKVANSNRAQYSRMVYDNFYNYMYIDSNNTLITYVVDKRDPKKSLKPIVIGSLSEPRYP